MNKIYGKPEVVTFMSEKYNMTKSDCEEAFDLMTRTFNDLILECQSFQVTGSFKVDIVQDDARKGINPHTQEPIVIPPRKRIRMSASQTLKNTIRDL